MADINTLLIKLNDLKSKIEKYSITPVYLGAVLEYLVGAMTDYVDKHKTDLTPILDVTTELDGRVSDLSSEINRFSVTLGQLSTALDTLTGTKGTAGVIDTFKDVEDFLAGFSDSKAEGLKNLLGRKASVTEVNQLTATLTVLTSQLNAHIASFDNYKKSDYKGVRQVDKIELDANAAVAVEMGSTTLGGVVEYYATGGFVLKASDGKRYENWSTRWWFYTPEGKIRTDVLLMVGEELWHWTGSAMAPVVAELTDADVDEVVEGLFAEDSAMLSAMSLAAICGEADDDNVERDKSDE